MTHPASTLLSLALTLSAGASSSPFTRLHIPEPIARECDSLYRVDTAAQLTTVHVLERPDGMRYFAGTMKAIDVPLDSIWHSLSGMADSKPSLKYFREVETVYLPDSSDRALYIEVGVAIARSWFLCDIDTVRDTLSARRAIVFSQNHDSLLNAMVRAYPHGWITVEYEQFDIEWWLEERGGRTHLGMFAVVDPDIWIPQWLFRVVAKYVYPSMLTSFEEHLRKKMGTVP